MSKGKETENMDKEKEEDYAALSDEEYIKRAARILASWATDTTMPILYDWSSSKCRKSIARCAVVFQRQTKDFFARRNLNWKRALAIGFMRLDEDSPLLLAPLWYCLMIPEGEEVVTIEGKREKYSRKMSHDVRFGVVAFGFEFEAPDDAGAEQNPGGEE